MTGTCTYTFRPEGETTVEEAWQCPHDAHGGEDRCLFHLTPGEREGLGVGDGRVSDRLRELAAQPGESAKRLLGAHLGDVDLSFASLDAPDQYPLDLRHLRVDGTLDLSNGTVGQPLDLRHATVDRVRLTEATFHEDLRAVGSAVGAVEAEGLRVNGDLTIERTAFEGSVNFDEARFHGDNCFRDTRFDAPARFRGTEFQGDANLLDDDACFENAVFEAAVTFERARFRYADFVDVDFGDEVTFSEVIFDGDAEFTGGRFAADVDFRGVEFHGGANVRVDDVTFEGATFEHDVTFLGGQFRKAVFEGVDFGGEAVFEDAAFDDETAFDDVTFGERVTFDEARFDDDTSLADADFRGDAFFRGVEFHGGDNVRDDDVSFAGATFGGEVTFLRGAFRYATFEGATFRADADFSETTFDDDADFSETTFAGEASFDEVRFRDDAAFDRTDFRAEATFRGAEFHGGANVLDDDATFSDAAFARDVAFEQAEFGYADFSGVTFEATADFDMATFTDESAFDGVAFGGDAVFDETHFESNVSFADCEFCGTTSFEGASFEGSPTVLSDDADFRETTFRGPADFSKSEFRYANFTAAAFEGDAAFDYVRFADGAEFDRGRVDGSFRMTDTRFDGDASFQRVTFGGDATFSGTEFHGGSNIQSEDATFESTRFLAEADFFRASFRTANFRETQFHERAKFVEAEITERMEMQAVPGGDVVLVDLSRAVLGGGHVRQPEDGEAFYDVEEATVRKVRFEPNDSRHELFDYFRFLNTDFEGFDFSEHMGLLARNNWTIHAFRYPAVADGGPDADTGGLSPAVLESTYLKAKNGADAFGQRKAASEFYIKEFTFRRQKNRALLADRTAGLRARLRAGGKWFGNWLLYQTCGYGERLWRVVYISAFVVVSWALLYASISEGTRGPGNVSTEGLTSVQQAFSPEGLTALGRTLYFSLVTFTTLGYGDVQPVGPIARTLASLESFVGALLVALVVFVIGRRMA